MHTVATPLRTPRAVAPVLPRAVPLDRRRRIDREAGRALEMLGRAIEYLADEYAHAGGPPAADDPQVLAMQILMASNREIYFACPLVPTFAERVRAWLGLRKP